MDVRLVMFKADGARQEFVVKRNRMVIGRTNQCGLRIPLSSVSRQHCELLIENDCLRVRDLGSSNGTFHNNVRIQEADLAPGDELIVGPVVFTVVVNGQPSEIKPVRTVLDGGRSVGGEADDVASLDKELGRRLEEQARQESMKDHPTASPKPMLDDTSGQLGADLDIDLEDLDSQITSDLDGPLEALGSSAVDDDDDKQ